MTLAGYEVSSEEVVVLLQDEEYDETSVHLQHQSRTCFYSLKPSGPHHHLTGKWQRMPFHLKTGYLRQFIHSKSNHTGIILQWHSATWHIIDGPAWTYVQPCSIAIIHNLLWDYYRWPYYTSRVSLQSERLHIRISDIWASTSHLCLL